MKKLVVHIAEVEVSIESGMGRVAWHWKNALEKRGYDFIHIGPVETGVVLHKGLFPYAAQQVYKRLGRVASIFLVHEPASGTFINSDIPTVLFSHGLERRAWNDKLDGLAQKRRLSTRIFFPLWRLHQCDLGMRKVTKLLLINQEDCNYAQKYYHQNTNRIFLFKNGVYPLELNETLQPNDCLRILFLGSWLERKGIGTLVKAAQSLHNQGLRLNWLLAGTGIDKEKVLDSWPSNMLSFVEVVPHFTLATEESIFASSNIFVLPSFFEGQPLALLQAMEAGRCCITTNCCGQRDLIQHGYNGLLHEPGNHQQLAFLIDQCVKNEELRMTLGRNAKSSVKNRSWENVSDEVVDQIESVLS